MSLNFKYIFSILGLIFHTNLRAQGNSMQVETSEIESLITQLIQKRPDFFYSKIQTGISATNPDFSADIRLSTRVKKDSLIFANASYMGFKAASLHLTKVQV